MKKMFFIIMLSVFLFVLLLISCSGSHCIKVGGAYEGVDGELEYCWGEKESGLVGIPVFIDKDGKAIYGFTKEQLQELEKKEPEAQENKIRLIVNKILGD